MLSGVPMVGNRPMTRDEFERLRAMNGLARAGTPGAGPLAPAGMAGPPGMPMLLDPATAAALRGILPFDPAAMSRPGGAAAGANGMPGLESLLPAPITAGQLQRPGQQPQQPPPLAWIGGNGAGANGRTVVGGMRTAIPLPRPPPGQPQGSRQGLDAGGGAPGLRVVGGGGAAGPESPANRHGAARVGAGLSRRRAPAAAAGFPAAAAAEPAETAGGPATSAAAADAGGVGEA